MIDYATLTDQEIMYYYDKANLMAIATMDRHVFTALTQVPRLLKERNSYKQQLEELTKKTLDTVQENS